MKKTKICVTEILNNSNYAKKYSFLGIKINDTYERLS